MGVVYDPSKTVKEMADAAGVSIVHIRNFLQRNPLCNYSRDRADYLRKQANKLVSENPGVPKKEIAERLNISLPTLRKYLRSEIASSGSKSDPNRKELSVGTTDNEILKSIIRLYLPGEKTFDCDLTYGLGCFYSKGFLPPPHRFDKYPLGKSKPRNLSEAFKLPDECFRSVVIDLPIVIDNHAGGNSFRNLNEMFETYREMLSLAWRLLKKGGIVVFKTVDFVLRNDSEATCSGQWATDFTIDTAVELGFDMTDRFILMQRQRLQASGFAKIRTGLKHGYFLVFTKK